MLIEIIVYVVQLIIDETNVAFVLCHGFLYQGLNINIAFHSMKFKACNLVFNLFSHLHHQRSETVGVRTIQIVVVIGNHLQQFSQRLWGNIDF